MAERSHAPERPTPRVRFDRSLTRLRRRTWSVLEAVPLRWWKRAEGALDAASEVNPRVRQRFGNTAIDELLGQGMAPTADLTVFDAVVAGRYPGLLREVVHGDPTVARPPGATPDVDGSRAGGGQRPYGLPGGGVFP